MSAFADAIIVTQQGRDPPLRTSCVRLEEIKTSKRIVEAHAQIGQVRRRAARRWTRRLRLGMSRDAAERLIHVGDERDGFFAHAFCGFDHQFGQADGLFFSLA